MSASEAPQSTSSVAGPCESPTAPTAAETNESLAGETAQNGIPNGTEIKTKRRKRPRKRVTIDSKAQLRAKRLGYRPEANCGVRRKNPGDESDPGECRTFDEQKRGAEAGNGVAPNPQRRRRTKKRSGCSKREAGDKKRKASVRKKRPPTTDGKSARYGNETKEGRVRRLAQYSAYRRKCVARETAEQHELRLAKARLRYHIRAKREQRIKTVRMPEVIPCRVADKEKLDQLHTELIQYRIYVQRKCDEAREKQAREKLVELMQRLKKPAKSNSARRQRKAAAADGGARCRANPRKEMDDKSQKNPKAKNAVPSAQGKPQKAGLNPHNYSLENNTSINMVFEPEITLLETSDAKLVPVRVIQQTCDDFDDLLEFETM